MNFFKKAKNKVFDFFYKFKFLTVMFLVGIIVIFWDLILKKFTDGKNISLIGGFLRIFSTHNTGGAWSIFSNNTLFLIIVSIIFIVGIFIFNAFFKQKNYFYAISLGLILSGALGNLYDRIKFGYVRDYIKLEFIRFPVFNICDIAICVGAILLVIYLVFLAPKQKENALVQKTNQQKNETIELKINNEDKNTINTKNNSKDKKENLIIKKDKK